MNERVKDIARYLDHYHIRCYYVGGCVRDEIMGLPPSDIDVCMVGAESFKRVHSILEELVGDVPSTVLGSNADVLFNLK